MSFRIVLAANERTSGDEEEITCSAVAAVAVAAAHAHALTKLPAVTIIISSSATAEFDRGSIFGRAGKMTRSLAFSGRGRTDDGEIL